MWPKNLYTTLLQDAFEDMPLGAALILLASGVLLPTSDVYSDIFLSIKLFGGNYHRYDQNGTMCEEMVPPHPAFGAFVSASLLLSWLFVTILWLKTEHGFMQKLKTLPLLMCQMYPQWRALRVLYYAKLKRDNRWQRMKEEWETGISHIGKHDKNICIYVQSLMKHLSRTIF